MHNDKLKKFLHNWRNNVVYRNINGKLLDIACGDNTLVKKYLAAKPYELAYGLDIKQWGNVDIVVETSSKLPFKNDEFDTISIVASLHYLPDLEGTISECQRILRVNGKIIVTTISENVGRIWAKIRGLNKDWDDPLTLAGIRTGVSAQKAINVMKNSGLEVLSHQRFMFGFNNLIIAKK